MESAPRHPILRAPAARAALAGLLLGPLLAVGCGAPVERAAAPERYNVVVVLSDALRASSLPLYGYPRETAPRLGELAAESVVFERHLAAFPGTPISVSQMLTGRLVPPLLMDYSLALAPVKALEDDLLVLPRVLREAGYRTGIVTSHPWFNARARVLEHFDRQAVVAPREGEPYASFEELVAPAEAFLAEAPEPFFLYLHSMDTHGPFRFHPGFDGYRDAPGWPQVYGAYDSEILYTDHWFGRLVDSLQRRGVLERTVLVFTSDHGEELGEMGPEYWNRSHGYTVRRVQLHVPLVVRLPEGRAGGSRVSEATSHLDLAPTLLGLARADTSLEGFRVDGRDLADRLAGAAPAADPATTLHAHGARYWGLYRGDLELHYDQWQDRYRLFRTETGRFNFPLSVPLDDAEAEGRLGRELRRVFRSRTREHREMPPNLRMPATVEIGVPTFLVSSDGPPPTFDLDPADGRWGQNLSLRLEAGPEERPGALTLATPWVPGDYRVSIRVAGTSAPQSGRLELANRFRLRLPGTGREPLDLDGSGLGDDGLLDAGIHRLGRTLTVEVSRPEGGVAITGFVLERLGADPADEEPLPEDLEERLRALGYVD